MRVIHLCTVDIVARNHDQATVGGNGGHEKTGIEHGPQAGRAGMPSESSLQDLARLGELTRDAGALARCAAAVTVAAVLSIVATCRLVHPPPLHNHCGEMRGRMRQVAAGAFAAAAVADSGLEPAELTAGRGSAAATVAPLLLQSEARRQEPVVC
ncbi:MAG: hypothetical protein H6515_11285 [Microthrixaceae bacterium]|nr:hypothetical protein [Microthrixaceae bacterium]